MLRRLRNWLVGGFVALAPLALTYYIFVWIFNLLDSVLEPVLRRWEWGKIPGIGAAITLALIFVVGALASNFFGKALLAAIDRLALRTPIVRPVYQTVRQIMDTVSSQSMAFKQVALIEYPRTGSYVIAFVTGTGAEEINRHTGKKMVNLFVPTTPNPTSGMLIFLPEDEVKILDMSVDLGLKLVISGGILSDAPLRETAAAAESGAAEAGAAAEAEAAAVPAERGDG